jgi:hypothetical protein
LLKYKKKTWKTCEKRKGQSNWTTRMIHEDTEL